MYLCLYIFHTLTNMYLYEIAVKFSYSTANVMFPLGCFSFSNLFAFQENLGFVYFHKSKNLQQLGTCTSNLSRNQMFHLRGFKKERI